MLASRTKSKCDAVAAAIGGNRVKTAEVDADSVPQLCELFRAFKPDIVVNVALPYQDLTIMDACLECGCNYLDTANYEPKDEAHFEYSWQWAYQDRFKAAGLTAILGCGFDRPMPPSTISTKSTTSTSSTATPATTAWLSPRTSTPRSTSAR